MPVKTLSTVLVAALALSTPTWAADGSGDTHTAAPIEHEAAGVKADPDAFADDICWVAPEWRDL